jgi:hypothetical protein
MGIKIQTFYIISGVKSRIADVNDRRSCLYIYGTWSYIHLKWPEIDVFPQTYIPQRFEGGKHFLFIFGSPARNLYNHAASVSKARFITTGAIDPKLLYYMHH